LRKTSGSVYIAGYNIDKDPKEIRKLIGVQSQEIRIDAAKWHLHRNVKVNGANVVKADIECSNGVIHVIDKVILPK
jgi:uncharacterized surface protein with fasciclin (FAS1) repeats